MNTKIRHDWFVHLVAASLHEPALQCTYNITQLVIIRSANNKIHIDPKIKKVELYENT